MRHEEEKREGSQRHTDSYLHQDGAEMCNELMTSMTNNSTDNMGNLFISSPHFSCCGSLKLTLPGQLNMLTIMASDASEWNKVADGSVSKCYYT